MSYITKDQLVSLRRDMQALAEQLAALARKDIGNDVFHSLCSRYDEKAARANVAAMECEAASDAEADRQSWGVASFKPGSSDEGEDEGEVADFSPLPESGELRARYKDREFILNVLAHALNHASLVLGAYVAKLER